MIWEIDWGPVGNADVRRIPWRTAENLCEAIMRFAETGRGPATRTDPRDPRRLTLVVPGAVAYMALDPETGVLRVERMFPRR